MFMNTILQKVTIKCKICHDIIEDRVKNILHQSSHIKRVKLTVDHKRYKK